MRTTNRSDTHLAASALRVGDPECAQISGRYRHWRQWLSRCRDLGALESELGRPVLSANQVLVWARSSQPVRTRGRSPDMAASFRFERVDRMIGSVQVHRGGPYQINREPSPWSSCWSRWRKRGTTLGQPTSQQDGSSLWSTPRE